MTDGRQDAAPWPVEEDLEAGAEGELDEAFDPNAPAGAWWARLPDFIKPDYPFDLPPARLPFAQMIFTLCGAPARCPQPGCRRSGECAGSDGPPCFRADREPLQQVLFLAWMVVIGPATDEQGVDAMRRKANPYRWPFAAPPPAGRRKARRRRR